MRGCFCLRDVVGAFSSPTPLPASSAEPEKKFHVIRNLSQELIKAVELDDFSEIVILTELGADPSAALGAAAQAGNRRIYDFLILSAAKLHASF